MGETTENEEPSEVSNLDISKQAIPIIKEVANGLRTIFQPKWYKYVFDLLTILAIVLPITILGAMDILSENTLGTLFGGIIGYTLSRFKRQN